MGLPVLASLQNLLSETWARSGAWSDVGDELSERTRDAGLALVKVTADGDRFGLSWSRIKSPDCPLLSGHRGRAVGP